MAQRLTEAGGTPESPRPVAPPTAWYSATPDEEGLAHYLAILRSSVWFIVVAVLTCLAAALLFLAQAEKVYESSADLLVTPIPRDNATLIGLGLPRESSDPTRDVETIARLIETPAVARRAARAPEVDMGSDEVLSRVDAAPVASSNVVTITAEASSPELAARIANAFGNASVAERTERMHRQLDAVIPEVRKGIAQLGGGETEARSALLAQLRDLEALRSLNDPTLRLETPAEPPTSPVSPRPMLTIAAAIIGGLFIGIAAALGMQLLHPRLQREEQLRRYRIPILARVPLERAGAHGRRSLPRLPDELSPASRDSYSLLAATLSVSPAGGGPGKRSVLVTGPSSGDGKTTSAVNVASALAESQRVALVETDTRRPSLARLLGLSTKLGLASLVASRGAVQDALLHLGPSAPGVQLIPHRAGEAPLSAVLTSESARWLIHQVETTVDWVVVDAAPLTLVPDALPLAQEVDQVIVVVRLGNTRPKALDELAELLQQQGIVPAGFVVIGGRGATAYHDSY